MSDHVKVMCSCGAVIMQCRCFDHAKHLEVRQDGCPACIARKTGQLRQAPRSAL
jgi:hypothetical protein